MNVVGNYYCYKILRMLTTSWVNFPAFKAGVIDENGKRLIADADLTREQSLTVTLLDKLVINLKRALETVPGGKTKLGAYAAALWLLRESFIPNNAVAQFNESIIEANLVDETLAESTTPIRYAVGRAVRVHGWVDADSYDFGNTILEGRVVGRASNTDYMGSHVFIVESGNRTLIVSGRFMEDAAAAGSAAGDSAGGETAANNAGNIKGADKKLKPGGMVRRKLEKIL